MLVAALMALAAFALCETSFYWVQRLTHTPFLYTHIHSVVSLSHQTRLT